MIQRLRVIADARWLALAYFLLAACYALALDLVVPPLTAPDEAAHMFRAAALAEGQLLPTLNGNPPAIGGKIDGAIRSFYELAEPTADQKAPTPIEIASNVRHLGWTGEQITIAFPNTGQYGPLVYGPQALGLAIGRTLGMSIIDSYRFARWLTALTAIGVGAFAIARSGSAAMLTAAVLSTPLFLFLATSLSQDGLLIAASALFAALIGRGSARGAAWLCALAMAMARPPYALLSLLLLRRRRDRPLGTWLMATDGPGAILLIAASVPAWLWVSGAFHQRVVADDPLVDPARQLAGLIADPWSILRIARGTIEREEYIRVAREAIGVLGRLTIVLPLWTYSVGIDAIWTLVALCLLRRTERSLGQTAWAALLLLVSAGAVYAAQYLTWTEVGAGFVNGVQGRYLLPLIPFLPLATPSLRARRESGWTLAIGGLYLLVGLGALGVMVIVAGEALLDLRAIYGSVFQGPWFSTPIP